MGELKDDLSIDKHSLDYEWERHPDLFDKWSKELVLAEKERDALKDDIEIEKAKLELDIRENPKAYNISKLTEGAVKATIVLDPTLIQMNKELAELNEDVKNRSIAVKKIDVHRKKALEKLVDLFLAGYFGQHKPLAKLKQIEKEESKSIKQDQNEKLKTRRRKRKE